jgi:serine phosphatase RsbU (regulator of sigma subunit)
VWLPLIDGTERLGVLELAAAEVTEQVLARYRTLASLAGLMVVSKSGYSDIYARTKRTREMTLQAELVWAFLPPRTFATERMLITATVEPAYDVGGDAYDYTLDGDQLNVSIFDAAGHDLGAGLLASVGMASCRSTRRAGGKLPDIAARADAAIASQFGQNRFVTALLCELDLVSGRFSWIPCGHPPPLLLRRDKVVKELARQPRLPLGMPEPGGAAADGAVQDAADSTVYTERLEPQDRVLLYTDGITDARAADGTPFGVERLSEFINRHSDVGTPAPETLRRLNHALTEYQQGRLADDATIVMLEWTPDHPERTLTP